MATSKIEWTDHTWNPVTGCTPISNGCTNCYAERMAKRLKAMGSKRYANGFQITLHPDLAERPLQWKKPRRIFVNSMSDLFHEGVPLDFIEILFQTMQKANQHTFQILTKRAERLAELSKKLQWPKNVWMGVTVESVEYLSRIELLKTVPSAMRFLSIEPLIGPIVNLDLTGIDWVIVGGESGPNSRSIKKKWVKSVRDQCLKAQVPFFFKQWGGFNKKKTGRLLEGKEWSQFPAQVNQLTKCFV